MAFLPEEEENQENQDPNQGAAGQILGGPSSAPIGGGAAPAASSAAPGTTPKATASGSFTNLNNYITANQGNDAAMGNAVKGTVTGMAKGADATGATFQNDATGAVNAATVKDDNNYTGTFANMAPTQAAVAPTGGRGNYQQGTTGGGRVPKPIGAAPATTTGGRVPQAAAPAAPASAVPALDNATFSKLFNAKYEGPNAATDVAGYGDTQLAFNKVQDYGQKAGPNSDLLSRGSLLQDTYGKGGQQYRGGEKTLDSFILGGGEQGAAALGDINQQFGNYGSNFENINALIGGAIDDGRATTDATRNNFQAAAKDAHGRLENNFAAAAKKANDKNIYAKQQAAALSAGDAAAWGKNGVSDDELAWAKSQGINLSKLVAAGGGYNTGDFVKKPDRDNYTNLMSMLNGAQADVTAGYDNNKLTAAGGNKSAGKQEAIAALGTLSKEFAPLQQKAAAQNEEREQQYQAVTEQLSPFSGPEGLAAASKTLGVPENVLIEARRYGIDPVTFLTAGSAVDAGDLGGGQFAKLLATIGMNKKVLGDNKAAGPAFSFNTQGLLDAIRLARPQETAPSKINPETSVKDKINKQMFHSV